MSSVDRERSQESEDKYVWLQIPEGDYPGDPAPYRVVAEIPTILESPRGILCDKNGDPLDENALLAYGELGILGD